MIIHYIYHIFKEENKDKIKDNNKEKNSNKIHNNNKKIQTLQTIYLNLSFCANLTKSL
jgi:hypothetical protein